MAVSSWAKLFWEPNWENAWWAVLDTISLVPLIPSLKHVRNSNEALQKIKEFVSKSKTNFEKVLTKFKTWRDHIRKIYRKKYFFKIIRFKNILIKKSQLEAKFEHAHEIKAVTEKTLNKIKWNKRIQLLKKYENKIVDVIRNNKWIFEDYSGNTATYAFIKDWVLVHIRRDNFQFLTAIKLNPNRLKRLLNSWIEIKSSSFINIIKFK